MTLNEKQKSILESAQRYFDEGDYSKTLPLLNALLSQKVLSADVHHMLGSLHYERGEFKNSILNFQKALEVDPYFCLLYTSPSPRDQRGSRMPSSA